MYTYICMYGKTPSPAGLPRKGGSRNVGSTAKGTRYATTYTEEGLKKCCVNGRGGEVRYNLHAGGG